MKYKFLLFDLDHTLLDFSAAEDVALTQFMESMQVADVAEAKTVYRTINQQMWKDLEKGLLTKAELVNTRFSRTFTELGRNEDGAALALRYQEMIGMQGHTFPGAEQLLATLADRGYEIYAATNGITYIQENRLRRSPIGPYFKKVFISEQMGTQKPEPAFYHRVSELITAFSPSQALMIGDSLTADIQGGINAGIDTAWYNPSGAPSPSQLQPTYTFSSYAELAELLP
ncbi:YjjG family noncanonical pyrimidine nucleotidase [Rothia sp. SD9660Na]|uniref:YjjG family noncanonical pyrimidine nucleotidase n=1 Tax=Rothia sp. SD9660Na TaxID=3047030 RepID=UPI0024BB39AD|nr:YjjG family noncanonical pyrimidine nucleotidase [Rothia sp. SD9660Na]WHS50200.1 YjjG family noncanonical pyrimidine nucleotidase [Rothia sp. SD9660Na]